MTKIQFFFKALRKCYRKVFGEWQPPVKARCDDAEQCSAAIYDLLAAGRPCMVARFGSVELGCVLNYLSIREHAEGRRSLWRYIQGQGSDWWWSEKGVFSMSNNAGFFPNTPDMLERFARLMLDDMKEVDILGSWQKGEWDVRDYMSKSVKKVHLLYLEPFWSSKPWSRALKGKKVLVIHPFAETIKRQYNEKRHLLFKDEETLPDFKLLVIKAIQSLGGGNGEYNDWFEALHWMEDEMDKTDYDVALIGCGAYGFPLAAHAKRTGHQALHIGGALQLLFGIKGKRWEDVSRYGDRYATLFNEHWVRPGQEETPKTADKVEGACYW